MTRPVRGHFDKAQVAYQRFLREIRLRGGEGEFAVGQVLTVSLFAAGDRVRVSGITKGRGFQGGVKRWNYKGGPMTHGSMFHRAPGSIGASSYPSRVFRGHHLPGHMGAERQTVRGLRVVSVDAENNLRPGRGRDSRAERRRWSRSRRGSEDRSVGRRRTEAGTG